MQFKVVDNKINALVSNFDNVFFQQTLLTKSQLVLSVQSDDTRLK